MAQQQRIRFSKEQRKQVLERSNYHCLCCGKKLELGDEDCTIDHVIPLSRGGTNDIDNLVTLCFDCNSYKSNDIYVPHSFFRNASAAKTRELDEYFSAWYDTVYKDMPKDKNPLISPRSAFFFVPVYGINSKKSFMRLSKKIAHSSNYMFLCDLVTEENRQEIEEDSGIHCQNVVNDMHQLAYFNRKRKDTVAIYAIHSAKSKKVIAIFGVIIDRQHQRLVVYSPYQNSAGDVLDDITMRFLRDLATSVQYFLHIRINQIFAFRAENAKDIYNSSYSADRLREWYGNSFSKIYGKDFKDEYGVLYQCAYIPPDYGQAVGIKHGLALYVITLRFADEEDTKDLYQQYTRTRATFDKNVSELDEDEYDQEAYDALVAVDKEHKEQFDQSLALAEKRWDKAHN